MGKSKYRLVALCAAAMIGLSACAGTTPTTAPTAQKAVTSTPTAAAVAPKPTTTPTSGAPGTASTSRPATQAQTTTGAAATATAVTAAAASATPVTHPAAEYACDATAATSITLNGSAISVEGSGATVSGSKVTITAAGSYRISGSLTNGQVIVETENEEPVKLVLSGATIANNSSSPIYVKKAEQTVIVLAGGTQNKVSDGTTCVLDDPTSDEPNAAIFSKDDLVVCGTGALTVEANYNDGIASKDGLIIAGGTITVKAADDGLRGKEYLVVEDGNLTVSAKGDGLKADADADLAKGYILIEGGKLTVTSGGDAIEAQTSVTVRGGELALTSGGGSTGRVDVNASAKGIKAIVSVTIDGGTFKISAADDAINTDGSLTVNGGTFDLDTGDDAMHANATLTINDAKINVTSSYEGIESAMVTINGGEIHIVSSDDGLNGAGGVDGSGMQAGPGIRGGGGVRPGQPGYAAGGNYWLYIRGGYLAITSGAGDGVDINGSVEMSGGVLLVNGPTVNMNGALDYDRGWKMTGGVIVATGSAGMAQAPDSTSTQYSILVNFSAAQKAGTLITIRDSSGKDLMTFSPTKSFQSLAFSSPELAGGATYDIYLGGSATGTVTDSLYSGGTYTPGTKYDSLTLSGVTTRLGSAVRMR